MPGPVDGERAGKVLGAALDVDGGHVSGTQHHGGWDLQCRQRPEGPEYAGTQATAAGADEAEFEAQGRRMRKEAPARFQRAGASSGLRGFGECQNGNFPVVLSQTFTAAAASSEAPSMWASTSRIGSPVKCWT